MSCEIYCVCVAQHTLCNSSEDKILDFMVIDIIKLKPDILTELMNPKPDNPFQYC